MDYSKIRGFNYQGSWGSTGLEIWRNFDGERMGHEIALGKLYFPNMNAIRLWLSHDAWARDPDRFGAALNTALSIADDHSLRVMPVLFNRWHSTELDYGGVYIDHFLPRASALSRKTQLTSFTEDVVGAHANDSRVFAWDLCNEPFDYSPGFFTDPDIAEAELAWLARTRDIVKSNGAEAPVTVGIHGGEGTYWMKQVEPLCDILSIHPYWTCDSPPHDKGIFEKLLDDYVEFAESSGKPLLATETCWGAIDDSDRVDIIRYTLGELKKREIGWVAYLLHHSQIADAHRIEAGPLGLPGNLSFIEADGQLRKGHEVFNDL